MDAQKSAFLIDFDNTLFDTEKLKNSIESKFVKRFGGKVSSVEFWNLYEMHRDGFGYIDTKALISALEKKLGQKDLKDIFYDHPFEKYLFSNILEIIEKLKKIGKVLIYTLGEENSQRVKTQKSGLERLIGKENIIFSKNKKELLPQLIGQLKKDGYSHIAVIDDRSEFLETAFDLDPKILTVWVKYGKYKIFKPEKTKSVDYETKSPLNALDFVLKTVAKIVDQNNSSYYLVKRGLSEKQVRELIEFSNTDSLIKRFTSDNKRFKNLKTYKKWLNNKKLVYSLTNKSGSLLGLIWFTQKETFFKAYPFTFAIRTYSSARGRGLAKEFTRVCYEDFANSPLLKKSTQKGIWLEVSKDNTQAIKLYEDFGFEKAENTTKNDRITMLLVTSRQSF